MYDYPKLPDISPVTRMAERPLYWEYLLEYARLKYEQGADKQSIQEIIDHVERTIAEASDKLLALQDDAQLKRQEPDALQEIRALCPDGSKRLWASLPETYRAKLEGAILGRFAGCTLGAPVEFWSVEEMRNWAHYCGQEFPPTEYWKKTKRPSDLRYEISRFDEYERDRLDGVPVDDDITYVILNLLVLEEGGLHFDMATAGEIWKKYLPRACTAEEVVLFHLRDGMDAEQCADVDNPYRQWIGADIRADAFGYVAAGDPRRAAELAYHDAYLTHRRNGIYAEMYFAAVIAAAFATNDVEEALKFGLLEIPSECLFARDVRWALKTAPLIHDDVEARKITEEYFGWMSGVHANLNAALTIFGLLVGGKDFTRVIGLTTAMGYDNDCNAATAGSIYGAAYGRHAIPAQWTDCFHNKVYTYLNDVPMLTLDDVYARFEALAQACAAERKKD